MSLARAEREIGLESWSIVDQESYFGYPADEVVLALGDNRLKYELHRPRLLLRALRDFDVIHFNAGQTLMPQPMMRPTPPSLAIPRAIYQGYARLFQQRDLPLLKAAGKAIFVTFQGDDARQGGMLAGRSFDILSEVNEHYYNDRSDSTKRRRIARFERYADGIFTVNPDLFSVLPQRARFLPYTSADPRMWSPTGVTDPSRPLRVVHAPSHQGIKGTRFVLDAVAQLQAEGLEFQFELLEGVSNTQAREHYMAADLIIDQLLIGWYGALAVEGMLLGKPVIAHIDDGDLGRLPEGMQAQLPLIRADPRSIADVLRTWLRAGRPALAERGLVSRQYAERWHEPRVIARDVAACYEAALARRRSRKTA